MEQIMPIVNCPDPQSTSRIMVKWWLVDDQGRNVDVPPLTSLMVAYDEFGRKGDMQVIPLGETLELTRPVAEKIQTSDTVHIYYANAGTDSDAVAVVLQMVIDGNPLLITDGSDIKNDLRLTISPHRGAGATQRTVHFYPGVGRVLLAVA